MNEVVFDASAMLALLHHERGEEKLTADLLARSVASTVNLAEVQSKLVKNGATPMLLGAMLSPPSIQWSLIQASTQESPAI